ncbi:hypothetical protein BNJ_00310 [Kaumoebavirus]|uniref:hypothetical protein n=1 Tax=Kaumoebavirus TaxID=1859492 RepID=UPI0009C33A16|nr:hypothetical protein BNJ_00310 [Kaumoebavirus]ARA72132.1 hypothetical protein BNJ_00310 [Kaumoebavirus]
MSPAFYYTWAIIYVSAVYNVAKAISQKVKMMPKNFLGEMKRDIFAMIILAPIHEELFFRMFLKDLLAGYWWSGHFIPLSFGLIHVSNYFFLPGSTPILMIFNVLNATFIGYFLGQFTVYQSIPLHILINVIGLAIPLFVIYTTKITEKEPEMIQLGRCGIRFIYRHNSVDARRNIKLDKPLLVDESKVGPEIYETFKRYDEKRRPITVKLSDIYE